MHHGTSALRKWGVLNAISFVLQKIFVNSCLGKSVLIDGQKGKIIKLMQVNCGLNTVPFANNQVELCCNLLGAQNVARDTRNNGKISTQNGP